MVCFASTKAGSRLLQSSARYISGTACQRTLLYCSSNALGALAEIQTRRQANHCSELDIRILDKCRGEKAINNLRRWRKTYYSSDLNHSVLCNVSSRHCSP